MGRFYSKNLHIYNELQRTDDFRLSKLRLNFEEFRIKECI